MSCTDDRTLDTEEFLISPVFEVNVFETEYTSTLINQGNDSILNQNHLRDIVDIDFFNEEFNVDNLAGLEFKFLAENSINRTQEIDFVFFDANSTETFRVSEPIPAGTLANPTQKTFSVRLTPQQIETITMSTSAEFLIHQTSSATNSGQMRVECILEGSYEYTGE